MTTFKNVTKQFGSDSPALEDLSFAVQKGEFIFLTGHSGSGKSTLLKILTKEYTPSSGDIEFDGQSLGKVTGSKVHHHRRKIGVVFQDYRLLPDLNVWENIALALQIIGKPQEEIEERVTDLLELVQPTEKAFYFPAQLSGGEAQRVGVARALATAPTVILADEPTGNLDPQTTLMIARLFKKIHELGTTVFFATHDLSVLSTFPFRRIHLEKGRLIQDTGVAAQQPTAAVAQPAATQPATTQPTEPVAPQATEAPQPAEAEDELETDEPEDQVGEQIEESEIKEEQKPAPKTLSLPKFSFKFPFGKKDAKKPEDSPKKENEQKEEEKPVDPLEQEMTEMLIHVESLDD